MRRILRPVGLVSLLGGLVSCSGGGGDGDMMEPPAAVATVTVNPPSSLITTSQTVQLTATTRDADGNTLTGRAVTWSSSNTSAATVSTSGLVSGVGVGDATITATSEGRSGLATVSVALAMFQPTSNTTLQGNQHFARVRIPAGVTVTATSALTLTAEDSIIIDGDVTGDCVAVTLIAPAVVINGDVSNACGSDPDVDEPPVLRIVSGLNLEIGAGEFVSTGDIVVTNDSTLTDGDFPAVPRVSHVAANARVEAAVFGNCNISGRTFRNTSRPKASSGVVGGNGRDGRDLRVDCGGNALLNNVTFQAQHGAEGGDGTFAGTGTLISSHGGRGGGGGDVRFRVTGSIFLQGDNTVNSGNGGDGGTSTVTGLPNPTPSKATSVESEGGAGGPPGLITMLAGGGITAFAGSPSLTFNIGASGRGGTAIGKAANGMSADERGGPAQDGGDAMVIGGGGGSSPDVKLVASGAVSVLPDVTGGAGGVGGTAEGESGRGGDGNEANPNGGKGGKANVVGGDGGDSQVKNRLGQRVSDGGDGGVATAMNAWGGNGWNDCFTSQFKPGGQGGNAGDVFGTGGFGGIGKASGMNAKMFATGVSHGGNGGHGMAPGDSGTRGFDAITGAKDVTGSFEDGQQGVACGPAPAVVIAGQYLLNAQQTSIFGNCPAFPTEIVDQGPIAIEVAFASARGADPLILPPAQVTIRSNFALVDHDVVDGMFDGAGSGTVQIGGTTYSMFERVVGQFLVQNGGVELLGQLTYLFGSSMGTCQIEYQAVYKRIGQQPEASIPPIQR